MTSSGFEALLEAVRGPASVNVLVLTGAGISLASGIPTFRGTDPGAVWSNEVMEKGTHAFFQRAPHESWKMYLQRFELARAAKPNAAHRALVAWEAWQEAQGRGFAVVTQNVDSLHEDAGSRQLVKVHGSLRLARCSAQGCELGAPRGTVPMASVDFSAFQASPSPETVPRCPRCDSRLRPHVLWFDENYTEHDTYEIERTLILARQSRVIVFVGTSFSVGVTELVYRRGRKLDARMFSIDPSNVSLDRGIEPVTARAEEALPELVRALQS
ncbi:RNA polymerase subunit sigma [Myxococcus sp. MISCRS1]|uniref:SIR2 family NAD-dependent protein deacylase n=1 Tax=Myxococcus TaxID=32 RepID=UPI00226EB974|nr:Sir2 family NAD-dependent protein deacetylase [Myxococcus sp. MISCRS1]MCY0999177.1 RNA polymerase subunit sigma [Myxococcus sp. MISCRS1]